MAERGRLWRDGLLWVDAALMQCARYRAGRLASVSAELDAALRLASEGARTGPVGISPVLVPTVAMRRQEHAELAFMLAALGKAVRAEQRLPARYRGATSGVRGALQSLRDLALHWDEPTVVAVGGGDETAGALRVVLGAAGATTEDTDAIAAAEAVRFAAMLDDDPPTSLGLSPQDPDEVGLAGAPLLLIEAWLAETREAFAEALADEGEEVPEPLDSRFPGDDSTAWPPAGDRVRAARWEDVRVRDRDARGALKRLAALVDLMLGDGPAD